METFFGVLVGISLSATCGFRVFVPFFIVSLLALNGYLTLSPDFAWMGSQLAVIVFAIATVVEVLAYYIPWLDNALDVISSPITIVAGAILAAAVMVDMDPLYRWSIAIIAGGGFSGMVKMGNASIRGASTLATAGTGNFLIATYEAVVSVIGTILSILIPPLVVIAVIVFLIYITRKLFFKKPVTMSNH